MPQTVKVFLYLFLQDRILTREVLERRNIYYQKECPLCSGCTLETSFHLFFRCRYAMRIWIKVQRITGVKLLLIKEGVHETWTVSMAHLKALGPIKYHIGQLWFMCTCWYIWLQRNNWIFKGILVPPEVVADRVILTGRMWNRFC